MSDRVLKLALCVILFGAVLITFLPSVGGDFLDWDDYAFILDNPHISRLSADSLAWMAGTYYQGVWHPLTWFSHALDKAVWGDNPSGHHLVTLIIHSLNALLFFLLFVRLCRDWDISAVNKLLAGFAVALLFGVHPLRVESVAWLSERKDVLCAFFFLLSMLSYLTYARSEQGQGRGSYCASSAFTILALLAKPMAMSLPFVFLVLDYYPLKRLNGNTVGKLLWEKLPLFLFAVGALALNALGIARSASCHWVFLALG